MQATPRGAALSQVASMFCVALLLMSWDARATQASTPTYDGLIEQALAAYDAGDFDAAFTAFEGAHALTPSARTHRGLGITALQAKRYALAYHHLSAALSDARQPLDAPLRAAARHLLALVEPRIARVQLPADEPLVQLVDGTAPLRDPSGRELLLSPGRHELTLHAADGSESLHTLNLQAGVRSALVLDTQPVTSDAAALRPGPVARHHRAAVVQEPRALSPPQALMAATDSQPPRASASSLPVGATTLFAVGGVSLLGAAVTGALTLSTQQTLEESCDERMRCYTDLAQYRDRGVGLRTGTNALLTAGGVALVGGLLWWIVGGGSAPPSVTAEVSFHGRGGLLQLRGQM